MAMEKLFRKAGKQNSGGEIARKLNARLSNPPDESPLAVARPSQCFPCVHPETLARPDAQCDCRVLSSDSIKKAAAKFALVPRPPAPSSATLRCATRDIRRNPKAFCLATEVRDAARAAPDARSRAAIPLRARATVPCLSHSNLQTLRLRRRQEQCPSQGCSR